jgi:hypothetical protein
MTEELEFEDIRTLNHPPVVGQTYLVPCVEYRVDLDKTVIMPVMGEKHEDEKYFNTSMHLHKDIRFLDRQMQVSLRSYRHIRDEWHAVLLEKWIVSEIVMLPKVCVRRTIPMDFPGMHNSEGYNNFGRFQNAYSNSTLKLDCKRCPHRGYDLSSTPVRNGAITCPMHGLSFDAKDGRHLQPSEVKARRKGVIIA